MVLRHFFDKISARFLRVSIIVCKEGVNDRD